MLARVFNMLYLPAIAGFTWFFSWLIFFDGFLGWRGPKGYLAAGYVVLAAAFGLLAGRAGTNLVKAAWGGHTWDPEAGRRMREVIARHIPAAAVPEGLALCVWETKEENALALGTRTIAVSRGLLERADDEELAGVIAHELGHLRYKDGLFRVAAASVLQAGLKPFSIALSILAAVAGIAFGLLARLVYGPDDMLDDSGPGFFFAVPAALVFLAGAVLLRGVDLLVLRGYRGQEARADAFAASLGEVPRRGLVKYLRRAALEAGPEGFFRNLLGTHPHPAARLRQLERLGLTSLSVKLNSEPLPWQENRSELAKPKT